MAKKARRVRFKGMQEGVVYNCIRHEIGALYKIIDGEINFLDKDDKKGYIWVGTLINENDCWFIPVDTSTEKLLGWLHEKKVFHGKKFR